MHEHGARKLFRLAFATALAAPLVLDAGLALGGDLFECQKYLTLRANTLHRQITNRLRNCTNKIRDDGATGVVAKYCNTQLKHVYNLGGDPGDGYINDFLDDVDSLVPEDCTSVEFEQLGHMVSGVNAPGTNIRDFVESWLATAVELQAVQKQFFEVGDTRQLLDSVINLQPSGAGACAANGANCGTWCQPGPPLPNFASRPNLCHMKGANQPACRDHACVLSGASGAVVNPVGAPVGLSGRPLTLGMCKVPPAGLLPVQTPDFMLLITRPARTFQPPPVIPLVPAITVCVDQLRSEGWCDCTAAAPSAPTNPASCLDHITNDPVAFPEAGTTCPETGAALESNCICGAGAAGSPCSTAGCLACVNSTTGGRCHSGTANSAITTVWSGASGAGSCVDLTTLQFKLLPPAICVNGMGGVVGTCTAPGPPDPGCTMVGGVACIDTSGTDTVDCTADDLIPPNAPTIVPFTTGTPTSTIEDFIGGEGLCSGGATPGMNCVTDADCGAGATCVGMFTGCGTGPNTEDCSFTAGPGAGLSCSLYESSNLSGWSIVGSFPALDGANGLGDNLITFTLACS